MNKPRIFLGSSGEQASVLRYRGVIIGASRHGSVRRAHARAYRRASAARNSPNAAQVTANWIQLIVK
jgi:hypothetical protein